MSEKKFNEFDSDILNEDQEVVFDSSDNAAVAKQTVDSTSLLETLGDSAAKAMSSEEKEEDSDSYVEKVGPNHYVINVGFNCVFGDDETSENDEETDDVDEDDYDLEDVEYDMSGSDNEGEIHLTDQREIACYDYKVKVDNDCVIINDERNSYYITVKIPGNLITGLRYHPIEDSDEGYVVIEVNPESFKTAEAVNKFSQINKDKFYKYYKNEVKTGEFKIKFSYSDASNYKYFINRISRDTGLEIIEE